MVHQQGLRFNASGLKQIPSLKLLMIVEHTQNTLFGHIWPIKVMAGETAKPFGELKCGNLILKYYYCFTDKCIVTWMMLGIHKQVCYVRV